MVFFSGFSWDEKEKSGSDIMRQIARKSIIYKKNEGTALDLPCSGGSHKGASPLDPRRPPQTAVL